MKATLKPNELTSMETYLGLKFNTSYLEHAYLKVISMESNSTNFKLSKHNLEKNVAKIISSLILCNSSSGSVTNLSIITVHNFCSKILYLFS